MVSSMVFHVLPTALEISMVCGILVSFGFEGQRLQWLVD